MTLLCAQQSFSISSNRRQLSDHIADINLIFLRKGAQSKVGSSAHDKTLNEKKDGDVYLPNSIIRNDYLWNIDL